MEQTRPQQRTFLRRAGRFAGRWFVLLSITYVGVVIVFWLFERHFVFPGSTAAEFWRSPVKEDTQDVVLTSADGTKLHGWWLPPLDPSAGAILHAHGNGGNLSRRGQIGEDLRRATRAGVLLFDYPGYGKSEGRPTEDGCYGAGEAAYDWLTEKMQIPPRRVVLMGESLGGGVAVELATRHEHRALVLLYTFTSLPAAAKVRFPFLPVQQLMRTRFDNLGKIARCTRPVFIAHGTEDAVIPFRQGRILFEAANEPKEFLQLDGYGHALHERDVFCEEMAKFLNKYAP